MGAATPFLVMGGLQAGGSIYQYDQQRKAGQRQQQYYNYLADQTENKANLTLKRGGEQVSSIQDAAALNNADMERGIAKVRGTQKANIGASGISADSVTAEDIARDTNHAENIDQNAIRFDADSKSWAAATAATDQAAAERDYARQLRMAGENARMSSNVDANTALINGASGVAGTWSQYQGAYGSRAPKTVTAPTNFRNYGYMPPNPSRNILSLY